MTRPAWLAPLALLALLLTATAAAPARADGKVTPAKAEARARMDRATALHRAGKLQEALSELTLAYSLSPEPDLLYAIAQVHVQLGQCPQAILFYERFLSTRPAAVPADAAAEAIETCRKAPESVAPTTATAPAGAEAARAPPPTPAPADRPSRWFSDKLGAVLVGGGIVLGAAAGATYASARSDLRGAEAAPDYQQHDDLAGRAHTKRGVAIALGAGGAVLVGAAVVRYAMKRSAGRATVGLAPASGGGLVVWSGGF